MINKVWLPQALIIGVDYDVFWRLNPRKLEPFYEAFKQKQDFETESFREKINFAAWLQGIYFAHAIASNLSKNARYFEKPIDMGGEVNNEQADLAKFTAWAADFNMKREGKPI